jgi:hypothetical protein
VRRATCTPTSTSVRGYLIGRLSARMLRSSALQRDPPFTSQGYRVWWETERDGGPYIPSSVVALFLCGLAPIGNESSSFIPGESQRSEPAESSETGGRAQRRETSRFTQARGSGDRARCVNRQLSPYSGHPCAASLHNAFASHPSALLGARLRFSFARFSCPHKNHSNHS